MCNKAQWAPLDRRPNPESLPLKLHLRFFANCQNDDEALDIATRIETALRDSHPSAARRPRRYYEATTLFEFSYLLEPATTAAFDRIVAQATSGWFRQGEDAGRSAVWNRAGHDVFLVPEVSWAALQLQEAA